ncbi:MAG: hypothetical protein PQJ48_04960 [Sphaerochaetaceae bacterium]|nr:DUF6796 family protein [uncultured Sphaerochaeta sp.]MDC7229636.1 hypothetical protein [Sphaerochaetaceae bacterium]
MSKAISQKPYLYRIMGISAVVAALLITIADYLLEFQKEYGVSSSIVETAWATMPTWRFTVSLSLCAFMIPFYLAGFWLLYTALCKNNKGIALFVSLLFSYGVVMGSPLIHGVMSLNGVVYAYGIEQGLTHEILVSLIEGNITSAILPVFLFHYLVTWVVAPVILFIHIIRGKSVFKRWTALLNPLVFLIVGLVGLQIFPQVFVYLAPGSINKGNIAMFLLVTINLWNEDDKLEE